MSEFAGKVAVVTGGSAGIGEAVVAHLSAAGAAVVYCGVGAAVDSERVVGRSLDVRSLPDMQALVSLAVSRFGGVDILVTSAGIQRYGTVAETSPELWDEVLSVNLTGVFNACQAALPELRRRAGTIVAVSSVQAFASQQRVAAYATSKAGVNALIKSIALDYAADGVRANAVCPGSVDTPMLRWAADLFKGSSTVEETIEEWGARHPLGRVAAPAEVAEVVAFLAGPRSSFVTGSEYRVDGGLLTVNPAALPTRF
ncbi:MAG: SDR family oxidoreductase [Hamadaea sp.]|nr:SDR family oxidoreductase [Hamadaea sp.]